MKGPTTVLAAVALAALLAACGSAGRPTGTSPSTTAPPSTSRPSTIPPSTSATTRVSVPITPSTSRPSTIPPSTPATTARPSPAFTWTSSTLDSPTRGLMVGNTWRAGCPVALDQLRLVDVTYWGFDGSAHTGQLVVNADSVVPVVNAFRGLYLARFPVRQMRLVDYYGGDDERSMAADNTSAFNCRGVPGSDSWSQHAYGRAVDVDPLENPEIRNGQVDPPSAQRWANRALTDPGMIRHGDAAWLAFSAAGWGWGGDWTSLKDYMHFSANGL